MFNRYRRTRINPTLRSLVRETSVSVDDLVYPLFIRSGEGIKNEVSSMPGVFQMSIDEAIKECRVLRDLGINSIILFVVVIFLSFLSTTYNLGIIGVIVFIRFIIVTVKAYKYKKTFALVEYSDRFLISRLLHDRERLIIMKTDITGIGLERHGLLKLPFLVFYLNNSSRISLPFIKDIHKIYFDLSESRN